MKKLSVACLFVVLSACGFSPLYVQHKSGNLYSQANYDTSVTTEMAKIKILPISERFGQQIRNELLDLLTPKGVPSQAKYRLEVKLVKKSVTQQAMRNDVTATSERIEYKVQYTLYSGSNKLVSGDSVAFVSYDILSNPYSTTMAQKKVEDDAAKIIANDISLRLGAYFHSHMYK